MTTMTDLEDDPSEIIITIAADYDSNASGHLTLHKESDTIYSVDFTNSDISYRADIDSVHIDVKRQSVRFQEPTAEDEDMDVTFTIPDRQHLQMFHNAVKDCQEICNYTLELTARLRDIYYSGIYTTLRPGDPMVVGQEIRELQEDSRAQFLADLLPRAKASKKSTKRLQEEDVPDKESIMTKLVCFYCDSTSEEVQFVHHPYVPRNFANKRLLICSVCIENWKFYRDLAISEQQLVLPGEVNEEICALCSDTPDTLILCNHCTRSYCGHCLSKVMAHAAYQQLLASDGEWKCMCCVNKVSIRPLLTREAWTKEAAHVKAIPPSVKALPPTKSVKALPEDEETVQFDYSPRQQAMHAAASARKKRQQTASSKAMEVEEEEVEEDLLIYSSCTPNGRPSRMKVPSKRLREAFAIIKTSAGTGTGIGNPKKRSKPAPAPAPTPAPLALVPPAPAPAAIPAPAPAAPRAPVRMSVPVTAPHAAVGTPINIKKDAPPSTSAVVASNSSSSTAETGKKGSKAAAAGAVGTPTMAMDEVHYFASYVQYLDGMLTDKSNGGSSTEDVCFLCKDGGEVMECDHFVMRKKGAKQCKINCLKVYHEGCLGYEVKEGIKWHCPRHFCSVCGGKQIKYACFFCPISLCAQCPGKFVEQFGLSKYGVMAPAAGQTADPVSIACETCINLMTAGKERGLIPKQSKLTMWSDVKQFLPPPAESKIDDQVPPPAQSTTPVPMPAPAQSASSSSTPAVAAPAVKKKDKPSDVKQFLPPAESKVDDQVPPPAQSTTPVPVPMPAPAPSASSSSTPAASAVKKKDKRSPAPVGPSPAAVPAKPVDTPAPKNGKEGGGGGEDKPGKRRGSRSTTPVAEVAVEVAVEVAAEEQDGLPQHTLETKTVEATQPSEPTNEGMDVAIAAVEGHEKKRKHKKPKKDMADKDDKAV